MIIIVIIIIIQIHESRLCKYVSSNHNIHVFAELLLSLEAQMFRRSMDSNLPTRLATPIRDMGGAPRNPAEPLFGLDCQTIRTDAFGGNTYRRVPTPLRNTSPFPDTYTCLCRRGLRWWETLDALNFEPYLDKLIVALIGETTSMWI